MKAKVGIDHPPTCPVPAGGRGHPGPVRGVRARGAPGVLLRQEPGELREHPGDLQVHVIHPGASPSPYPGWCGAVGSLTCPGLVTSTWPAASQVNSCCSEESAVVTPAVVSPLYLSIFSVVT